MYFVGMLLKLKLPNIKSRLTIADSTYAHAAVINMITQADADAGLRLHNMARNKQITLALLNSSRGKATLRLTFMAKDGISYAHMLLNMLATKPYLRIGQMMCQVEAVDLNDPTWSGVNNWLDLTNSSQGNRRIHIRFMTPTAINKRGANGKRFASLFPLPLDTFSGLVRRWQGLAGPELPDDLVAFIQTGGCIVSKHNLHTVEFRTKKYTQIGFVGNVVYECQKDEPVYTAAINSLSRLARYAGIGYHTMQGMGAVQVKIAE